MKVNDGKLFWGLWLLFTPMALTIGKIAAKDSLLQWALALFACVGAFLVSGAFKNDETDKRS